MKLNRPSCFRILKYLGMYKKEHFRLKCVELLEILEKEGIDTEKTVEELLCKKKDKKDKKVIIEPEFSSSEEEEEKSDQEKIRKLKKCKSIILEKKQVIKINIFPAVNKLLKQFSMDVRAILKEFDHLDELDTIDENEIIDEFNKLTEEVENDIEHMLNDDNHDSSTLEKIEAKIKLETKRVEKFLNV